MLSGLDAAEIPGRCEAILDKVKLPREHWGKTHGPVSPKGMKQRVKLAQGLLHEPDLLVLDEPMNGLDPMGRQEMAGLLTELAAAGASILISSHILAELESLCRNILILNWGRILASGSQKEIRGDLKNWSEELTIQCDDPEKLARHLFRRRRPAGFDLDAADGPAAHPRQGRPLLLPGLDRLVAGQRSHGAGDPQPEPFLAEHF